jgi:metallopeptidase family M12-like protein/IPT/TIG domain-containing protein
MERVSRLLRRVWIEISATTLLAAATLAFAQAAHAAPPAPKAPHRPLAAAPGEIVYAPDDTSPAELVTLDPSVADTLLATPDETAVRLEGWPLAPTVRRRVQLTRHDVYSPDAKVYKIEGGLKTELPRSRLAFFWGTTDDAEQARVFVSVDPDTREIHGLSHSKHGMQELKSLRRGSAAQSLVAAPEALLKRTENTPGELPVWTCNEEGPDTAGELTHEVEDLTSATLPAITSLHTATVAIDTDNEFMSLKFGDNTTNATNYIASLFAAMNVMYERDLLVRLVQGTTFLRVSTAPDPYTQTSTTNANGNQLGEFANYWSANEGGVQRAVAAMLSGKQNGSNSASGIAYALAGGGSLCSTSTGYSFSQVFKIDYLAGDTLIVGHEIGHNFGSPHTHCYSPPIDTCYSGECYVGPTSCPAPTTIGGLQNVTGTLMSYCHLLGGGCSSSLVFHPRTVTLLAPNIQSKVGICIFPAFSISSVSPNNGPTTGGTPITISGSAFQAGATVSVGGVAATAVSVPNASTITAVTGPHATGTVDVVVTNPGSLVATKTNAFFFAPPATALSFFTLTPCRVLDTRNPNGPLGGPALAASSQRLFTVAGTCGIPAGAKSLSANVTIVNPAALGFLAFYAGNAFPFGTSTINFSPGQVRANNAILTLATDGTGTLGVQNGAGGTVNFLVDVNGYFQ